MGYVRDIRRKIGHDPLLIVGASVIAVNDQGELLLQRRSDNGCWGYHGGCVELNERVEDAARREFREETGLIAEELTLLGVFSGPEMAYTYPNGDLASIVDVVFVCRAWSGEMLPQDGEVSELRFFAPEDVPENISPPNIPALKAFLCK
ncbi:MAG: NUDIX hydrolase [Clostridia bacterium]|nr:NUDIX hydrolase [Clostridia bacterium]